MADICNIAKSHVKAKRYTIIPTGLGVLHQDQSNYSIELEDVDVISAFDIHDVDSYDSG